MKNLKLSAKDITFSTTEKGNSRFTGIAYSGSVIPSHGMFENVIIDLEKVSFKEKVPLFRDHDASKIVGVGKLVKSDNQLLIEGEVFDFGDGQEVLSMQERGFDWELSVGLSAQELELTDSDYKATINGLELIGEHSILRQPTVKETSFVALGADSNTSTSFFNWFRNKGNDETEITLIDNKNPSYDVGVQLNEKGNEMLITKENMDNFTFSKELLEEFGCGCSGEAATDKPVSSILESSKNLEEAAKKWIAQEDAKEAAEKEDAKKNFFEKVEKMKLSQAKSDLLMNLFESEDTEKLELAMILLEDDTQEEAATEEAKEEDKSLELEEEKAKEEAEIKAKEELELAEKEAEQKKDFKKKNKDLFEFKEIENDYAFETANTESGKSLLHTARKLVESGKFNNVASAMLHLRNSSLQ